MSSFPPMTMISESPCRDVACYISTLSRVLSLFPNTQRGRASWPSPYKKGISLFNDCTRVAGSRQTLREAGTKRSVGAGLKPAPTKYPSPGRN